MVIIFSLLTITFFGGAQRLPWSLYNANGNCRCHKKPINQQKRKWLSCPVVFLARSIWGGESVVRFCQLAHSLFNYLALRQRMNTADLWICPFPIYQKTIKASLYALSPKHCWSPWPISRMLCLFPQSGLSNGLQQVGGRSCVHSQVQYVLESLIMKDLLKPFESVKSHNWSKPGWIIYVCVTMCVPLTPDLWRS